MTITLLTGILAMLKRVVVDENFLLKKKRGFEVSFYLRRFKMDAMLSEAKVWIKTPKKAISMDGTFFCLPHQINEKGKKCAIL
jgi:hypothetical protein